MLNFVEKSDQSRNEMNGSGYFLKAHPFAIYCFLVMYFPIESAQLLRDQGSVVTLNINNHTTNAYNHS